jgi:hypothetical protein
MFTLIFGSHISNIVGSHIRNTVGSHKSNIVGSRIRYIVRYFIRNIVGSYIRNIVVVLNEVRLGLSIVEFWRDLAIIIRFLCPPL